MRALCSLPSPSRSLVILGLWLALGLGFETPPLLADGPALNLERIKLPPEPADGYEIPIPVQDLKFSQENGRRFLIPLNLRGKRRVKVRIIGGHDNTGDGGLNWRIVDSTQRKIYGSGFTGAEKARGWVVEKIDTLRPILIIEDLDTKFGGKLPGNRFRLAVEFP